MQRKIQHEKAASFFFFQSITAILTEKREKQFSKPTHVSVYLFQDLDWSRL